MNCRNGAVLQVIRAAPGQPETAVLKWRVVAKSRVGRGRHRCPSGSIRCSPSWRHPATHPKQRGALAPAGQRSLLSEGPHAPIVDDDPGLRRTWRALSFELSGPAIRRWWCRTLFDLVQAAASRPSDRGVTSISGASERIDHSQLRDGCQEDSRPALGSSGQPAQSRAATSHRRGGGRSGEPRAPGAPSTPSREGRARPSSWRL